MSTEDDELNALVNSIEGVGFQSKKKKKKKKKTKKQGKQGKNVDPTPVVDDEEQEDDDDDEEDGLWRLAQGSQRMSGNASLSTSQQLTNTSVAAAHNKTKKKGTKAEERLGKLEREYESVMAAMASEASSPGNSRSNCSLNFGPIRSAPNPLSDYFNEAGDDVQHAVYLSELTSQLESARAAVAAEASKKASRAPVLSSGDLLGLTEASLKARSASDKDAAALTVATTEGAGKESGDGGRSVAIVSESNARLVSTFVMLRASDLRQQEEAVKAFVPSGLEEGSGSVVPEGTHRPESRAEHERILRVARKVVQSDVDEAGSGIQLEASLVEHKAMFDKNFAFLKPHHPLHSYYQALRRLPLDHLNSLVASSEHEAGVLRACVPSSLEALVAELDKAAAEAEDCGGGAAARTQCLGQRIFPLIQMWVAARASSRLEAPDESLPGKLTGMILALPEKDVLPLVMNPEDLKDAAEKALAALEGFTEVDGALATGEE